MFALFAQKTFESGGMDWPMAIFGVAVVGGLVLLAAIGSRNK